MRCAGQGASNAPATVGQAQGDGPELSAYAGEYQRAVLLFAAENHECTAFISTQGAAVLMTIRVARAGLRRSAATAVLLAATAVMSPAAAPAQAAGPDSASLYERLANVDRDECNAGGLYFESQYARRAYALFTAAGDERGQARTLMILSDANVPVPR